MPSEQRRQPSPRRQYELDVVKIHKTTTTNAKKAKTARARVSTKGRMILRARIAGDGPLGYRYDTKTAARQAAHKAYKAVVAKAARGARAHFEPQATAGAGSARRSPELAGVSVARRSPPGSRTAPA